MRLPCYAHSPAAIEALTRDGIRLVRLGNLREAEYVLHRAAGGADHLSAGPEVALIRLRARTALAGAYRRQGRHAESETLLHRSVAKAERDLGPDMASMIEDVIGLVDPTLTEEEETHADLRNPAARRLAYA
jgi:hypothetical protein